MERHLVQEGKPFLQAELASHLIGGSLVVAALVDRPTRKREYVASVVQLLLNGALSRVGGPRWANRRARARQLVRLATIYAALASVPTIK